MIQLGFKWKFNIELLIFRCQLLFTFFNSDLSNFSPFSGFRRRKDAPMNQMNHTIVITVEISEKLFTPICRGSISELSRRGGAWGIKSSFKSSESGEVDVLLQNYREKKIIEKIL